jgi:serine/threonine protein kinase
VLDGRYRLEEVLGSGGFGVVYRAYDERLDRRCAIKEYLPVEVAFREGATVRPRSRQAEGDYAEGLNRFRQEALQLVRFHKGHQGHPNIIVCRDYFLGNGTAYLVMEYEEGSSLGQVLRWREESGRPLEEPEALDLLRPLLSGLAAVHAEGVLHRDIKPGNIYIRRQNEQPVLLDFGAAKADFAQHSKSQAPYTPEYAAPEQTESAGKLGPWTDLYGLGAVLWRIMAGRDPPKVTDRTGAVSRGRPDPLVVDAEMGGGRFSAGFVELVRRCLLLDEEARPQSAAEVLERLDSLTKRADADVKPPEIEPETPKKPEPPKPPARWWRSTPGAGPPAWTRWALGGVMIVVLAVILPDLIAPPRQAAPRGPIPPVGVPNSEPAEVPVNLLLSVSPASAVVTIDGSTFADGDQFEVRPQSVFRVSASAPDHNAISTTVDDLLDKVVMPGQVPTLQITLCPSMRSETYEYRLPDSTVTAYESVGRAKQVHKGPCPAGIRQQRALADRTCAASYPGTSRDTKQLFDIEQADDRRAVTGEIVSSECHLSVACVIGRSTTMERTKTGMRLVPNNSCVGETMFDLNDTTGQGKSPFDQVFKPAVAR